MLGTGLLRMFYAFNIIIVHTGPYLGHSYLGYQVAVRSFFIFSGFFVSMVLDGKYKGLVQFWIARWLKLFPLYFGVIGLIVVFSFMMRLIFGGWETLSIFFWEFPKLNLLPQLYLPWANLGLLGHELAIFLGININQGNMYWTNHFADSPVRVHSFMVVPQGWVLSLMIYFYLLAPLFHKSKLWILFGVCLLSLGVKYWLSSLGLNHDPWSYRFFPSELFFFILGIFGYRLYKTTPKNWLIPAVNVAVSMLFLWLSYNYDRMPYDVIRKEWVYYLSLTLLLPWIFSASKRSQFDKFLGELSYPVFLSHVFVNHLVNKLRLMSIFGFDEAWRPMVVLIFSIGMSMVLLKYVQASVDKYKQTLVKTDG